MSESANPFRQWIQLEQPRLGTRVTYATDEFFAAKERLIDAPEPVFIDGKYNDHGKWMDGWESRRKRTPGHDYCIVKLGVPGILHGVDINTRFFTGNFPPQASLEACVSDDEVPAGGWTEILGKQDLQGDSHHYLAIDDDSIRTHLRLNIFPDGGVARLRVYGEIRPDFAQITGSIDLVALENGGRAIACSDEHYGSMHNLNVAGRGVNTGDGWETARRRGPGNDWVILVLGHPGRIESVEVDTAHFKGNYPDRVALHGAMFSRAEDATNDSDRWQTLLPETKLGMDKQHFFAAELNDIGTVSHVRMSIFPDGGVSRLRLHGRIDSAG
ncbi:MAG: allantoicase [Gammaproteobacteria bacterium]|nr:allantoicase [Gammaproteobacteria bacterium]